MYGKDFFVNVYFMLFFWENLNERDIEDYLNKLQGGWLSEDDLDDQDSDDENRDTVEVIRVLQEENDDDDDDDDGDDFSI
ncbi:piggyBac transposable element [Vairimorpha necatrix]|uniref:PiggyBac transposable element n=1 Tax=Vairimorpha necatrix TaxID=6039 RepID=A0AAX4JG34_9MICR